mgnify:FL=1
MKCHKDHWLSECPIATDSEKAALLAAARKERGDRSKKLQMVRARSEGDDGSDGRIHINDWDAPFVVDSGAICSIIQIGRAHV